jgi:hypothetical protein
MAKRSSWPGPLNAYQILYYTFKRNPYNRLFEPPIENIQKKETKMTANGPIKDAKLNFLRTKIHRSDG